MTVAIACVTRLGLNAAMVGVGRKRGRLDDAAWKQSVLNSRGEDHTPQQGRFDTRGHRHAADETADAWFHEEHDS